MFYVFFFNKKEQNDAICRKIGRSRDDYVKQNKPDSERQIPCNLLFMSLGKKIRHVSKRTLERRRDPQEEKEGQERVNIKITTYIHASIIMNPLFSIIHTNKNTT